MKKAIICRYGEVYLKGKNRNYFESVLVKNIRTALNEFECKYLRMQNRLIITDFSEDVESELVDKLTKVFGLHSISVALEVESNPDDIMLAVDEIVPSSGSFRVNVRRANKRFPVPSTEFAGKVGGHVLSKNHSLTVDLHNPDHVIEVDIREGNTTFVFSEKIPCAGGMPVSTAGVGTVMLSGGIDSPVAAYLMAKRGMSLVGVHFHSFPYTSEMAKQKVVDLAEIVSAYAGHFKLYVVPFTEIQQAIHEHCPAEYMITIMRRFMMRISERIAKQNGSGAIITGESLAQVASQTVESITCTGSVANVPVFRPLIGFDKSDIIDIARKIGTYETSILPYEDCCTVFLPEHPVIKPKLESIEKSESVLDVEALIAKAMQNVELIEI